MYDVELCVRYRAAINVQSYRLNRNSEELWDDKDFLLFKEIN